MSEGNGDVPAPVVAVSRREEIMKATEAEVKERAMRCMARIKAILEEEKCILTAVPGLQEVQPGRFMISCEPGIKAV